MIFVRLANALQVNVFQSILSVAVSRAFASLFHLKFFVSCNKIDLKYKISLNKHSKCWAFLCSYVQILIFLYANFIFCFLCSLRSNSREWRIKKLSYGGHRVCDFLTIFTKGNNFYQLFRYQMFHGTQGFQNFGSRTQDMRVLHI